ncbi:hypothetical protein HZZ13_01175 [Bradyrhizobium sp. CNPSo 4010]|uniref:Uncharacterized protein n=1 Tax=Bradyrhizobium agreste TaxID=2751811 RepID=A0ABS0PH08_9BRAD|nr:hypothetical protein [Bradyrhizobium agreste]MBH5396428.1 hypothetical protein [Bradyrhizobium agreste]
MAPELEGRITQAIYKGQLTLLAVKVIGTEPNAAVWVRYCRRGDVDIRDMQVGAVIHCTGIVKDPRATPNPAVRSLVDRGLARVDPLCIGIDTDADCAIIDRNGIGSRRLFAIGPLTRAAFWEIIAIPDIRNQCAALAARLAKTDSEQPPEPIVSSPASTC